MENKMDNAFINAMEKEVAWKLTENGCDALNTTFDANLDLFATIGALRTRTDNEITDKFAKAYAEEPLTAIKLLFYARDIEEGLGERRTFRLCLKWLANFHPEVIKLNIENIVKYGRYDDLYELVDTPVEKEMFKFINQQWNLDVDAYKENKPVSLLAKWLKSVNTSNKESVRLGKKTAKALNLSEKLYRKNLSALRERINVLEKLLSTNNWSEIDFNNVPGGAMKKYVAAFYRHQEERYKEYLDALKTGKKIIVNGVEKEAKINTKNLYPYEIMEKYLSGRWGLDHIDAPKPEVEAMWNSLKDWIQGTENNIIVMADTSGSMSGRPMATSVGLGIYFAERNNGPFHNKFMTFASRPSWIKLNDNTTLAEKINCVPDICDNTNLEAGFNLILKVGVDNNLTQDEMPKLLVVITDMEFDRIEGYSATKITFYNKMKQKYNAYGYELPEIVFWNVAARQDTYHTQANTKNVRMVSGQATSIFKSLIDGKKHSPYEFMLETLYKDRYDSVVIK